LSSPGRSLNQLSPYPLGVGMGSHVQVHYPAPAMRDEEEYVQSLQSQRLNSEEVGCPDMRCVVTEKGSPGLLGRAACRLPPVPADRLRTDIVAQLAEFAHDAHAAPAGILAGNASDQLTDLFRDT